VSNKQFLICLLFIAAAAFQTGCAFATPFGHGKDSPWISIASALCFLWGAVGVVQESLKR
jgi:hypothetical protein